MASDSTIFRGTESAEADRRSHELTLARPRPQSEPLDSQWLKDLCREAGAADVGFVEIGRSELDDESVNALRIFPRVQTLIAIIAVSNPDAVRSVSRSTANLAWHGAHSDLDETSHTILAELKRFGVGGVSTSVGFPMKAKPVPGEPLWEIAHKPIAVQAGMGHMGINRNVIHPEYGNFILLETLLIDAAVSEYDRPLDYNPCNGCNLCVAACPVGAVSFKDDFDFFACLNHNYREFLFGFEDWVHTISDAGSAASYKSKFDSDETISMWQSISFGPNYKAPYCQAVCPAGDDIIGPYMADREAFRREVAVPLIRRKEDVYVQSGTRAEKVASRNSAKRVRYIDYKVEVSSSGNFLLGLKHRFDRGRAKGVAVTIDFVFPDGTERTVTINSGDLDVSESGVVNPSARVKLLGDGYIRMLHADAGAATGRDAYFELTGDPSALGALLACLS